MISIKTIQRYYEIISVREKRIMEKLGAALQQNKLLVDCNRILCDLMIERGKRKVLANMLNHIFKEK